MARINPTIANRERRKLKLSLEQLSKRAGVNKATLHRIESGRMTRNAEHVVDRLAKVFKLDPDSLTADLAEPEDTAEDEVFSYRSQLNVRISHEARNALALVANRYRITPTDVIEIAPLLFHIVASETLKERKMRLESVRTAREQIADLGKHIPHITERFTNDWDIDELDRLEDRSITARDIRGEMIDRSEDHWSPRPSNYDPDVENPFVTQLRQRLADVQGDRTPHDSLECWPDGSLPRYAVCREEAVALLNGDGEAADHIIEGRVGLHEIPKELRGEDKASERAHWIREKAAELAARNTEWLEAMSISLKDVEL